MYDVHLGLIWKRVVDFLLVLIELFLLGVTADALREKKDRKSAISLKYSVLKYRCFYCIWGVSIVRILKAGLSFFVPPCTAALSSMNWWRCFLCLSGGETWVNCWRAGDWKESKTAGRVHGKLTLIMLLRYFTQITTVWSLQMFNMCSKTEHALCSQLVSTAPDQN